MPTILVPSVAAVDLVQIMFGNIMVNTLNFTKDDESDFEYADLVDLVDGSLFAFLDDSGWVDVHSSDWALIGVKARSLADPTVQYERTSGLPINGNSTAASANQLAVVQTLYTAENSRNGRGRLFFGGVPTAFLASTGLWSDEVVAHYQLSTTNILTGMQLDGYNLVVVSKYFEGAPRATGVFFEVTHVATRAIPATQAQRRIGRGS